MTSRPSDFRWFRWFAACLAGVGLLALSGLVERVDRAWFDGLQAATAAQAPLPADTALVLIDEQSLAALGQPPFGMRWPWPRTAFAALLAGLQVAGADRVAVDLLFLEQSAAAEQDLLLGAVAAGWPAVSLASVPGRQPVVWPDAFRAAHSALFTQRPRWGQVRAEPDSDGVIRRYRLAGSLAAVVDDAREPGRGDDALLRWRGNLAQLRLRGVPVVPAAPFVMAGWPLLDRATQQVPGLEPERLHAAIGEAAAPNGDVFAAVRGRTVLVGANAAATFDAIATPLGAPEAGVVLHWNALANLRGGGTLVDSGVRVAWGSAVLAIAGLLLLGRRGAGLLGPALACAAVAGLSLAAGAALFLRGYWFAPGLALAAAGLAFTAIAVERYRIERARKLEIRGWFGAYVSPAVVDRLLADPHAIELGGEERELTILFSDIAGYTTLSERLQPPALVALINRFLEQQTECILAHGGYLDKYIGDAVMAVFGSPEPLPNSAAAACRAALDCHAALQRLNDEIESAHGFRLGMRTGINTGPVVVGNIGSTRKRNYTVLGDAVNLASRLEGANKETGTSILLGPRTAELAGPDMLARPVARLQVKGKTEAVEVFELLAGRGTAAPDLASFAATYSRGFQAYCERRFDDAVRLLGEALEMRPDDRPARHFSIEAAKLAASPPPPDWRPVLKLETK